MSKYLVDHNRLNDVAGCSVTLVQGVTIGQGSTGVPCIANDVYIATRVTRGNHVSIGAGTVAVKDIRAYCVVVCVPARLVKVHNESHATDDNMPGSNEVEHEVR